MKQFAGGIGGSAQVTKISIYGSHKEEEQSASGTCTVEM